MEFFEKMTRKQAEEYFRAYINGHQRRVEEFRQEVAANGGPSLEELDFSPESLVPVWIWMMPRIRRQEVPQNGGEPVVEWVGGSYLTADSVRLIDGLAAYVAECLLRNVPGVHWAIGYHRSRRYPYIYQNQPVLAGFKAEFNPRQVMLVMARGVLNNNPRDNKPESLLEIYRLQEKSALMLNPDGSKDKSSGGHGLEKENKDDEEITIRVGSLEVGLYRDNPDVPGPRVPGYERMDLFFDDDAYVALEEDFKWTDQQVDSLDAQLFAKLGEDVGVIWEDKEVLILYLPRRIRNPVAAVKKAVREMVRHPLPEVEIPRWSKRCREVGDTILRLARERN